MKQVAGTLKLDLAQYREKQAFAQFGSDLDEATRKQLSRGERLVEILNQGQYIPMQMEEQVLSIFAVSNGYCDEMEVSQIPEFEAGLQKFVATNKPEIFSTIVSEGKLSDETIASMKSAIEEYSKEFAA